MSSTPTDRLSEPRHLADLLLYRLSRLQARVGGRVVRLCESAYGVPRREAHGLLTDEGRRMAAELFERVAAINRDILAPLDASERLALDSMLCRLQAAADGDELVFAQRCAKSQARE